MEKLKLPSRYLDRLEKESRSFGTPIRIRKSVWEKVTEAAEETGMKKVTLAEILLLYALDNVEYVTTEEYLKENEYNIGDDE